MSTPSPHDPLSRILAGWQMNPPADPAFRPAVWQRVSRARHDSWPDYLRAHLAVWCLTAVIASAAAGWAGRSVAHARLDADRERMIFSYLGELDPRVLAELRP